MLTRTEGIVLKTQEYAEADLVVTHLTLDRGIIKTFAKSPRKTKSRFGSSLEPLTHAKISLWGKEHTLPKITQSDIISTFQSLRENIQDFANVSKLAEILIFLMPEGIPNKRLFSLFLNTMKFIESFEQKQKDSIYLISQIRLLMELGYAPRLKGCGRCGAKSFDFYPGSGTILCKRCVSSQFRGNYQQSIKITGKTANFYSQSAEWHVRALTRLKPPRDTINELSFLLEEHITYLLNKRLQSSEFLAGLPNVSQAHNQKIKRR